MSSLRYANSPIQKKNENKIETISGSSFERFNRV